MPFLLSGLAVALGVALILDVRGTAGKFADRQMEHVGETDDLEELRVVEIYRFRQLGALFVLIGISSAVIFLTVF
jgi:hypothetical protein